MICVANLKIGYPPCALFENLNFQIPPHSITCLLAENGTGKSTLLRTLLGLHPAMSGEVFIDGHLLHDLSPQQRAETMAVVFAENSALPYLRVQEILELSQKVGETKLLDCCQKYGIHSFLNRQIGSLSSGEKQNIFLVRALLQNPKILLLDEPESHLDPIRKIKQWNLLRQEVNENQRTIFWSTHDWSLAQHKADWLLLLKRNGESHFAPSSSIDVMDFFSHPNQ